MDIFGGPFKIQVHYGAGLFIKLPLMFVDARLDPFSVIEQV